MNTTLSNFSVYFSILGHFFIFILIGFQLSFNNVKQISGQTLSSIQAYTFQLNRHELIAQNKNNDLIKQSFKDNLILKSISFIPNSTSKSQHEVAKKIIETGNGKPIPALVALLHKAIQAQQIYPEHALEMQRQGMTTIKFLLFPDGSAKKINISHSSGTPSLDQASIDAVNKASPFHGVQQYLNSPQEYEITVEFVIS